MSKSTRQSSDIRAIGFMVLGGIVAILLYYLLSSGSGFLPHSAYSVDSTDNQQGISTRYVSNNKASATSYYAYNERKIETFDFDPNTADSTALLRLGLAPFQVRGIYKYRAMGGVYHQAEDFARVPGLTVKEYKRLTPHIVIGADYQLAANVIERKAETVARDTTIYPEKLKPGQLVNINNADTNQLKHIPSVGSYYARAMVRYREQLGGYSSRAQLMEISGFPEQALDYINIDTTQIRKISINSATLEELRRHPYLRYYRAKRIVDYRRLYGKIHTLRQLLPAPEFTENDILRLEPYIRF